MLKSLLNCMKVKCKTNSLGSGIVVLLCGVGFFLVGGLSPSSVSVQHDDRVDTYGFMSVSTSDCIDNVPIVTVSIMYR